MVVAITVIWFVQSGNSAEAETGDFALHASHVDVEELSKHELPMIIDFGANECIPCLEMAPVLSKLNDELRDKAIIKFVDVWENPKAATGFPVMVIPTQVFIEADGTPYVPNTDLGEKLMTEMFMYIDPNTDEHLFTYHQGGLTETEMRTILSDMGVSE